MNTTHNTQFILRTLNISHLEYCEMVEAGGYKWMQRYFFHIEDIRTVMPYSKMFWKWWVNEWEIRDEQFIQDVRFRELPYQVLLKHYNDTQDIKYISVSPNKWVRNEINELLEEHILKQLTA